MAHHTLIHKVTFGECDPAAVVYFPRYFHWFHTAMEDWFDAHMGLPYAEFLQRYGLPAARTQAEYQRPCRQGELVAIELSVGERRLRGKVTEAWDPPLIVDQERRGHRDIPDRPKATPDLE